ncbi:hypothetical protein GH714_006211 [Hevea brasiliensis]|uniref:Mediator complex subunit 15 KIX domain-containing protein n=1 Tax=Hevea brasiliensis TaxID=3981 RepID=A0A6A6M0S8_HEVBR|nr:hypothetical protein GH714_006211 [Hevea brasiliensis]
MMERLELPILSSLHRAKTLKRHLPFSSEEGLLERKKIAVRFEEEIYDAATSQSDYLRKTSLKMLKMDMETIAQDDVANSAQSNSSVCSNELQVQERFDLDEEDLCQFMGCFKFEGLVLMFVLSLLEKVFGLMGTLKRNLPFCGEEGLLELKKIAERFEEKIYVSAISQSDYLQKISLKMPRMDAKSRLSLGKKIRKRERELRAPHRREGRRDLPGGGNGSWTIELRESRRRASLVQNLMDPNDWRVHLQRDSRERIVNKIIGTLKRLLPFSGDEVLKEIAERFEEKIYVSAISQYGQHILLQKLSEYYGSGLAANLSRHEVELEVDASKLF